jgi:hypothetical protein
MPTSEEFQSATSSLQELARRYHGFQEEPESFLQYLKSQKDRAELREYLDHIKETQVTVLKNVQQIRPVVFLRRIVVERILAEEPVSAADIQELQKRIDDRDTEYFSDYPELHDEIANQKERAHSAFNSWDLFKICFGIDYYHRSKQVKEQLRITAEFLQEGLWLSDCDYHRAAFDFNQNFGTDHCWIALYPEEAKGHQAAYQIFFGIRDNHYAHGLIAGGRIDDDLREVEQLSANGEIDTGALVERIEEKIPRFKKLNRGLAESQVEEDGREDPIERPLNKILYGPPGTGKTYSVQKRTLQIIEGTVQNLSEDEISERFRGYLEEGRVEFTTFHPSYSYEEFVEGLRYDPEKQIPVVQNGVLKKLARRAVNPRPEPNRQEDVQIWKISLGRQTNQKIFERCIAEDEIAIGYIHDYNFADDSDRESVKEAFQKHADTSDSSKSGSIDCVHQFVNRMQEGDFVAVYNDPKSIRAIGVVKGSYEFKGDYDEYPHVRPVEWLDQSEHEIYQMNGAKNLTRKSLYPLDRVPIGEFLDLLPDSDGDPEPHVLIIDEINRGNLSRIFGELVTLLEADKRKGAANEMSVTLPYSQERFSLPSNLYVLGTMNTADRSIALVDVALRRRFDFEEMMPDAGVIRNRLTALLDEESEEIDLTSDQIDLIVEVFQVVNRRVSYLLDRDHQIGHSYFLEVESMKDLHDVWYSRVLPLLQEYFYNDRRRLVRVLGEHDPEGPMGFVTAGEQVQLLGDGSASGEAGSWGFHEYGVGKLEAALRNTFSS